MESAERIIWSPIFIDHALDPRHHGPLRVFNGHAQITGSVSPRAVPDDGRAGERLGNPGHEHGRRGDRIGEVEQALAARFGRPLYRIGEVTADGGLELVTPDGRREAVQPAG